jgi:hypothetical protein
VSIIIAWYFILLIFCLSLRRLYASNKLTVRLFPTPTTTNRYILIPASRAHPSNLLFYKVLFDGVFALVVIVQMSDVLTEEGLLRLMSWEDYCPTYASVLQFSFLGSQLWMAAIGVDLLLTIMAPFTVNQELVPFFVAIIVSTSGLSAVILNSDSVGSDWSIFHICWAAPMREVNVFNVVFVYTACALPIMLLMAALYFGGNRTMALSRLNANHDKVYNTTEQSLSHSLSFPSSLFALN